MQYKSLYFFYKLVIMRGVIFKDILIKDNTLQKLFGNLKNRYSDTVWSLECTIYCLSTIKREEKKEKAINNYLTKYVSASPALLLSLSRTRDIYI